MDTTATENREVVEGLTLGVLSDVKKILDIAVGRGAFRAEEMTSVGGVYDSYVSGLNFLIKQNDEALASRKAPEEHTEEAGSKE